MADKNRKKPDIARELGRAAGTVIAGAGSAARAAGKATRSAGTAVQNSGKIAVEKVKDVKVPQVHFDLMDVLSYAVKFPGVRVEREEYLRKELIRYYPLQTVETAIRKNPAQAGIERDRINMIADQAIEVEAKKVTALSFAASLPGGAAVPAAVTADTAQFFASAIRIMQKLAYLYGFQELEFRDDTVDDQTMNEVVMFLGVMFGAHAANVMVAKLADAMAKNVSKKIISTAMTKGVVYPAIQKIAKFIGIRMTKQILADTAGSAIPVVGGVISGGITFSSFMPCAKRLQKCFKDLKLSDPEYYRRRENTPALDVDFTIVEEDCEKICADPKVEKKEKNSEEICVESEVSETEMSETKTSDTEN